MPRPIRITAGSVSVDAELNDSRTAAAIAAALPIEAKAETWGDEIYFDIGQALAGESPREVVELGDLGYWPPGQAFCIFFGPTPDEPRRRDPPGQRRERRRPRRRRRPRSFKRSAREAALR